MKTSELTGAALDWAVAKLEGLEVRLLNGGTKMVLSNGDWWYPSESWAQGGPIIERESMHVDCLRRADHYRCAIWEAWPYATGTKHIQQGPTPLIAAMRCYVASKLGDEIEIPDEIMED